jgi:hypothetical protein
MGLIKFVRPSWLSARSRADSILRFLIAAAGFDRPVERCDHLRTNPVYLRAQAFLILQVVEHFDGVRPPQLDQPDTADRWFYMSLEYTVGELPSALIGLAIIRWVVVEQLTS